MCEDLFDENIYKRDVQGIWKPLTVTTTTPSFIKTEIINKTIKELNEQLKADVGIDISKKELSVPLPEKYIINSNATILFWQNGEKTVVKRCADDEFNPRLAFLTAFFQNYCGMSKNKANKYLANLQVEVKESKQKPKHMKEETEIKIGDRARVINREKIVEITDIRKNSNLAYLGVYKDGSTEWLKRNEIELIKEEK